MFDSHLPLGLLSPEPNGSELTYAMIRGVAAQVWSKAGRLAYIDATDLAHDCFIRMARRAPDLKPTRAAQVAYCTTVIRRVLVDEVRRRSQQRLVARPTVLLSVLTDDLKPQVDLLDLDMALEELAVIDERQAKLVELCFFGGYSQEKAGEVAGVSNRTVRREWGLARAWLLNRLKDSITL